MATFTTYRDGAGGKIAKTILGKGIKHLTSWREFFDFTYSVSCTGNEATKMLDRAKKAYECGHIGERVVILATLFAMDRSAHAVKLETGAGENLLGILNYADDQHSAAVAACIMLRD